MNSPVLRSSVAALLVLGTLPLSAAESDDIQELKAMMSAMKKTMSEQSARIATLEKQLADRGTKSTAAAGKAPAPSSRSVSVAEMKVPVGELPANAVPKGGSTVRDADNFTDQQQAAPRANNVPIDPKLKGFIPIPGTDTMFKIGGSARVDTILDFGNNGNPNLFTPSSIPVPGQSGFSGGERSTVQTKGTRLSLELRRPVPFDDTLRIYSEFDFFDDSSSSSMKLRVRHFYGQAWNFLIGQTFSAFMDPDAFPDVLDYQGPNGILNRRQPQIRFTLPLHEGASKFQVFASIEQPEGQIDTATEEFTTTTTVVNHTPDGVVGFRWEGPLGHLQGAGLFRELSFEADHGRSGDVFGWGSSLSGALNLFEKDKLTAQVSYGQGMARYVNDLGGQDLDAALDSNGRFRAIPAFATMAGYTHQWGEQWRSTVSAGYVRDNAPEALGPFTVDHTFYGSVNLVWHPTTSFRMGLEYLYGRKETQNGAERDAHRLDLVVRYDLIR